MRTIELPVPPVCAEHIDNPARCDDCVRDRLARLPGVLHVELHQHAQAAPSVALTYDQALFDPVILQDEDRFGACRWIDTVIGRPGTARSPRVTAMIGWLRRNNEIALV